MADCAVGYYINCLFVLEVDTKTILELARQMEVPPSTMRIAIRSSRTNGLMVELSTKNFKNQKASKYYSIDTV